MIITSQNKKRNFSDFVHFDDSIPAFSLVDILNDVNREKAGQNFLNAPGEFVYVLNAFLDYEKLINEGITSFSVDFYKENPIVVAQPAKIVSRASFSPSEFLRNKKTELENASKKIESPISSYKFDVLGILGCHDVGNDTSNIIAKALENAKYSGIKSGLSTEKSIRAKTEPIFEQRDVHNENRKAAIAGLDLTSVRAGTNEIIDPVAIAAREFSSSNSSLTNNLYEKNNRKSLMCLMENASKESQRETDELLSNISDAMSGFKPKENISLGEIHKVVSRLKHAILRMEIDKLAFSAKDKIYAKLSLIKKPDRAFSGIPIGEIIADQIVIISHGRNLSKILKPKFPPHVSMIHESSGQCVLKICQTDPAAVSVEITSAVYRGQYCNYSETKSVAKLDISADNYDKVVEDFSAENSYPNRVHYRAVSVGPTGEKSEKSANLTSQVMNLSGMQFLEAPSSVSIHSYAVENLIEIHVGNFPIEATSVRLVRQDLSAASLSDSDSLRSVVILKNGKETTFLTDKSSEIVFSDENAKDNAEYRYIAIVRLGKFCEVIATGEEFVKYKLQNIFQPFDVKSTPAIVNKLKAGGYSVNFELSLERPDGGTPLASELLSMAGLNVLEIQNVTTDYVPAFVIERLDKFSGKREFLDIVSSGKFFDNSELAIKRQVSRLTHGRNYSYIAKLSVMKKSDLLELSRNKNQTISEQVKSKLTGFEISINVAIPTEKPTLTSAKANSDNHLSTKITWSVKGSLSEISHFIVRVKTKSGEDVIATPTVSLDSSNFSVSDAKYANYVGTRQYIISIVYRDLTVSSEISTNELTNETSIPRILINHEIKQRNTTSVLRTTQNSEASRSKR